MEQLNTTTRFITKIDNEPIVLEILKDATGKIVRQQSFTKDRLDLEKARSEQNIVRVNEMLALLTPEA